MFVESAKRLPVSLHVQQPPHLMRQRHFALRPESYKPESQRTAMLEVFQLSVVLEKAGRELDGVQPGLHPIRTPSREPLPLLGEPILFQEALEDMSIW